jgi:flagellar protein FlaG
MEIRPVAGTTRSNASEAFSQKPVAAASANSADPPAQAAALEPAQPAPSAEQLAQAIQSINSVLQVRSQDLEFSVDSESDRTIITVTDTNTHEVIRQMPSQEAMDIAKAIDRLHSLLIKQSA